MKIRILRLASLVFLLTVVSINAIAADSSSVAATQTLTDPDITASLLKVTGGLLLVILAILGSAWFYRRFGNMTSISHESLKVIGGLSMGQKEKIVLMQVGDEQLLLGVSPGRIQMLHVLEKPIEAKPVSAAEDKNFASQLSQAVKQWKSS